MIWFGPFKTGHKQNYISNLEDTVLFIISWTFFLTENFSGRKSRFICVLIKRKKERHIISIIKFLMMTMRLKRNMSEENLLLPAMSLPEHL